MSTDVLALRRPTPDLRRLRRLVADAGLDGVVLTTPASVQHATGYRLWFEERAEGWMLARPGAAGRGVATFAVVALDGPPVLVSTATFAGDALAAGARAAPYGAMDLDDPPDGAPGLPDALADALERTASGPVEALVGALADAGLRGGRVGLEPDGLPPGLLSQVRDALPGTALPVCRWVPRLARMVKTDEELQLLEQASALSEHAAREGFAAAAQDAAPRELRQAYRVAIAAAGADLEHYAWSAAGACLATTDPGLPAAPAPPAGEVSSHDWGLTLHGYATDTGVTVVAGAPPPWVLDGQQVLADCIETGAARLADGARASDAARAMRAFLDDHGIATCFPHGHGIGLELRDLPIVLPDGPGALEDECGVADADVVLESGAVVNLEVTRFLRGAGALQVERSFVVAPGGGVPLCAQQRDVPVVLGERAGA